MIRCRRNAVRASTLWAALASFSPSSALPPAPAPFELLGHVRQSYRSLDAYHDRAVLEVYRDGRFEGRSNITTLLRNQRLQLHIESESPTGPRRHTIWTEQTSTFHEDRHRRQFREVPSLAAALPEALSGSVGSPRGPPGPGVLEALVVAALLSRAPAALEDPEGAALEGAESCEPGLESPPVGGGCWRLTLSRMAGDLETRLWIDRQTLRIRRLEVELASAGTALERAARAAGLAPPDHEPKDAWQLQIHHLESPAPSLSTFPDFRPPPKSLRVAQWQEVEHPANAPGIGFTDEITVDLLTLVVRAVDRHGEPLPNLEPHDLRVRIAGHELPVEALDWVSSQDMAEADPFADATANAPGAQHSTKQNRGGALVVFFFQADLEAVRVKGQLRLLPFVRELLTSLHPEDRLATVSFDSHLKLWHDFTTDHLTVTAALEQALRFGGRPSPRPSRGGASIAQALERRSSRLVASPEHALEVTAEALGELAGAKSLIYLGWGLGRFGRGGVSFDGRFHAAVRALNASQTTVFVLDVTDADFHSLEVGLQNVAQSTGGTYSKTNTFTAQATRRLARTLRGYYLLSLDRSRLRNLRGKLKIELVDGHGSLHFVPRRIGSVPP